ncbi:MAG: hypothetical protein ACUVRK_05890, partial [Spirochaetota bacterium]
FITKFLAIYLRDNVIVLDSNELLSVAGGLDKYLLYNEIIAWCMANKDIQQFVHIKKKEGVIPDGILGDVIVKTAHTDVAGFVENVKKYCDGDKHTYELAFTVNGGITVTGTPTLYGDQQVFYRYATVKAKDRLKAFLWHIFVCATLEFGVTTYVLTKDVTQPLAYKSIPNEKAKTYLKQYLHLFKEGNKRIIPFFPETSYKYYDLSVVKKKDEKYVVYDLEDTFYRDNEFNISEYSDPYVKRALYKVNIFNDETLFTKFKTIATEVFNILQEYEIRQ